MSKKDFLFHKLQQYIKEEDHTSIGHVLKWEYKKDALFDLKNDDGLTLIHIACFEGQRDCLEVFLRNGASVHIRSSVGWTPLHAATLGGKLEVVDYLLSECSADPLAKDEMGCVASDLTMDKEILDTLNKYTNEVMAKRELERLAASLPPQHSKRNTYCFELIEHDSTSSSQSGSLQLTRAQSMFIDTTEAEYLREQMNKSKQTIGGFQQRPSDEYTLVDWNFGRQNSAPPTKLRSARGESPNGSSPSTTATTSASPSNSAPSSTLSQFMRRSSGRDSASKGRLRESRNRDSGVFDEDTNDDSSSERSLKTRTRDIPEEHHYNVV